MNFLFSIGFENKRPNLQCGVDKQIYLVKRFMIATILYFMYIKAYENCFKSKAHDPTQSSNTFMITTARSNFRAIAKHKALQKINAQIKNYNFCAYVSARIYNQNFHQQKFSPARKSSKRELSLFPQSSSIDKLSKSINLSSSEEAPKEKTRKSKKLANHSFLSSVEPNSAKKKNNKNLNQNENYHEKKPQLVLDLSKHHRKQCSNSESGHKIRIKRNQSSNPEFAEKVMKNKSNRSFIHENIVKQMMSNKFPNRSIIEQNTLNNQTIELKQRFFNTEIERINPWIVRQQMEDQEQF